MNPDGDLAALAAHAAYRSTIEALRAQPRRWLVTGAAGFIGSHLVEALLEAGQSVVGFDDLSTGFHRNLEDVALRVGDTAFARFDFREGDVRDVDAVAEAVAGTQVVLHHAALVSVPQSIDDPGRAHEVNTSGFLNVLDAARHEGVGRVVYASTSAIYGDDDAPTKAEGRLGQPLSMYAATKAANEHYATAYSQAYGLTAVGLRYFNVFGSRQDPNGAYAAVIPAWIDQLARGDVCTVHGDGRQTRDFCHVANVVGANLLAATAPSADLEPAFNVGTGRATTLRDLFTLLRDAVVAAHPGRADLATRAPEFGPPRAGDVRHSCADIGLAERRLGFRAAVTIREGLDRSLAWYLRDGT